MEHNIGVRIPPYVYAVTDALERAGHRGYLVGGSLRDLLLGKTPHDYDLTTDATPEEMLAIFSAFRVIPTGLKHGTLTVLSEGQPIEVTTHRVDGDYRDSRRPESVSFTRRLEEDLSRRDFTVNAMAWHPVTGLVDLFSGKADLQNRVLRAVGDPAARFTEDALRILRAFRFSAQLDFEIEANTLAAAGLTRTGLGRISAERIFGELTRLLTSPAAARGMRGLLAAGWEAYVFSDTVLGVNDLEGLDALPVEAPLRLAFLLTGNTVDRVRTLCRTLKAPNAFSDGVCGLLAALETPLPTTPYEARRFVCTHWHCFEGALTLRAARGEDTAFAAEVCKRVAKNGTAIEIRRLAVGGRELQEQLGVRPARTGALLARLQDLCWQDPARNKKAVLLALAAEIVKKEKDFV